MPKQAVDQIITQWMHQDQLQYKDRPIRPVVTIKYMKALLDVAGSDGVLTDAERKWILGYAAIRGRLYSFNGIIIKSLDVFLYSGVPAADLETLKNYKIGSEDSTAIFSNDSKLKTAEHFQCALIYDGFRAATADGSLKQREIDAISALAKKCGMTDEKFQQLLGLFHEEEEAKQKRIALLFPKSYGDAIKAIDKHYGR